MMAAREIPPLPIDVSMDDPEPLYRQLVTGIRALIVQGVLTAGTPIPSVRALAQDVGCSVITTRRAYQELEQLGLIRTRQGMATTVADIAPDVLLAERREPVREAAREAIRRGRAADLSDDEIRTIFDDELRAQ